MNKKQALALILVISMTAPTFTTTSIAVRDNNEIESILSDDLKQEDKKFLIVLDVKEQTNYKKGEKLFLNIEFRNAKNLEFGNTKFFYNNHKLKYIDEVNPKNFGQSYTSINETEPLDSEYLMLNHWMKQENVNRPKPVSGNFTGLTIEFEIKEDIDDLNKLFYFQPINDNTVIVDIDENEVVPILKAHLDRVNIEYEDIFGEKIADSTYIKGFEGEDYNLEDKEIEGYKLEKIEGDKEGKFPDGIKTVKYIYKEDAFNVEDPWETRDFEFDKTTLKGFSKRGYEKIKLGKTELTIPEKNDKGEFVTEIGEKAFYGNTIKGNITIPQTIKTIGESAFYNNEIENVKLNEGLENIGISAFNSNKITGKLELPKSLKNISKAAFTTNKISEVTLGENLEEIGREAFRDNKIGSKLTIPNNIEKLGAYAFSDNLISELDMNANISVLEREVFGNNKITGDIKISDSIKEIKSGAFMENKIKNIKLGKNVEKIGDNAFYNNEIETVKFNEGLKSIQRNAFYFNKLIGEIDIPSTVEIIDKTAFNGNGTQKIILNLMDENNTNKILEGDNFTIKKVSIWKMEDFKFSDDQISGLSDKGETKLKKQEGKLEIPDLKEITIGAMSFADEKYDIKELTIGNSYTNIPKGAFRNNNISKLTLGENIRTISGDAFKGNKLDDIKFNEKLETIGQRAFANNIITKELLVSDSVKTIEKDSFDNNPQKIVIRTVDGLNINKLIDGYNHVIDPKVVTGGDITVKYIDEEGKEISTSEVLKGNIGDSKDITIKEIDGYKLKSDNKTKVVFIKDSQEIKVVYEKIAPEVVAGGDITVKYIDEEGKEISTSEVLKGNIGDSKDITIKEIDGYKLKSDNKTKVVFTKDSQEIKVVYEKIAPEVNLVTNRLNGSNRFSTAVEVSKEMYNSTDTVIIANGYKEADALTSSVLSKVYEAPILLTETKNIPEETLKEIKRLGAKNIIIIGGENSVSNSIQSQIAGVNFERIAGNTRYETSKLVAEKVMEKTGTTNNFVIVRGDMFPDALSVSGLAIKNNAPILLTEVNNMNEDITKLIKDSKAESIYIAGGKNSVSEAIETNLSEISKVERISGNNRYETAIEIAKKVNNNLTDIIVASGENGIDAMVAGPLTSKYNTSIILTEKNTVPEEVKSYMKSEGKSVKNIIVIGGENTITENTVNGLGK